LSEVGKLLVLEVCPVKKTDRNISLEVEFPSGFAHGETFQKPYKRFSSRPLLVFRPPEIPTSEHVYLSNKDTRLVHYPNDGFWSLVDCWNILAYRKINVYFEMPTSPKRSSGWVAINPANGTEKKTLKYFYL